MSLLVLNVRGGAKMRVPADLNQAATYVLLEQEDWFEDEIRFVRRWLGPGMQAVDVGANYGVYTVAMAQAVGATGKVWSFEPTPQVAETLQGTLDLNDQGHVALGQSALSDRAGTVLLEAGGDSELNRVGRSGIEVPSVTLDGLAASHDWSGVDFLKLDVEGHEPQVVGGGSAYLARHSPLLMVEVDAREARSRALDLLEAMQYQRYRLVPGLLILAPVRDDEPLDAFQINLFSCKPDRAKALAARGLLSLEDAPAPVSPGKNAWPDFARAAPYARAARWRDAPGFFAAGDDKLYYDGLASYARSRDAGASAAERLAWLRRAFQRICAAIDGRDSLPRVASYARIASELGMREAAVAGLRQAADRTRQDFGQAASEPFLAPSPRSERVDADLSSPAWLESALFEQLERVRAFSSLYGGAATLSVLQPVLEGPFCSPEAERRRQLVRMRGGQQQGPARHPLLCQPSDENLNPAYWCRG